MKKTLFVVLVFMACATLVAAQDISQYNIVWSTQSRNSSESMPLGGGDIGCNVWVENNDIMFYIGRSGTFDENGSMLKLGRVRLQLSPNPFKNSFRQELKLKQGHIEIKGDNNTVIRLWVEVFKPVIHLEVSSDQKLSAKAIFESWRTTDRQLSVEERHQAWSYSNVLPDEILIYTRKDTIRPQDNALIWYHQDNNREMVTDREAVQQHLGPLKHKLWNPMKDLIFGGVLVARDMKFNGVLDSVYVATKYRGWIYESVAPAKTINLDIVLHTAHGTPATWLKGLQNEVVQSAASIAKVMKNELWWEQYWDRSHIYINTDKPDNATDKGWEVGRNYNVFRYQLACNAFGEWPTKFNGGLFTFDADFVKGEYKNKTTPDFRRWGGSIFTAQNQRLVYWPMLKSGDFSMMKPQFEFYRRALANTLLRTQTYWGHRGASFTEQLENSGLPGGHPYERLWGGHPLQPRSDSASTRVLKNQKGERKEFVDYGFLTNQWIMDHYDGQLEFSKMILDYQLYSGADINQYLPFIEESVRFFDEHYQYWSKKLNGYPLDANGKLILYPGSALETYKYATNSTNTLAGLKSVLTGLIELPARYGTAAQRTYWKGLLNRLPGISTRELKGHTVISPALSWESKVINTEMPQLYPVFPYHLYGVGKPNLQLAQDTWHFGADSESQYGIVSWHPDPIYVADLGLTDEAKKLTTQKLSNSSFRYPTFWGPGLDWAPDHNWGGSGMIALQEMMLQADGKKIYLMPAWPKDWNADVKLHAPMNTTIEAIITDGKVMTIKVTPAARAKDVVIMN